MKANKITSKNPFPEAVGGKTVKARDFNKVVHDIKAHIPSKFSGVFNEINDSDGAPRIDCEGKLFMPTRIIAATGTNQGNAAQIEGQLVFVSDGDGTKGVILPPVAKDAFLIIVNLEAANLKIYPASGEKIQGSTADANITLAANDVLLCGFKDDGDWYAAEITGSSVG